MTGLENIILQIKLEADNKIHKTEAESARRVKEIIEDAQKQKEEILDTYREITEQKRKAIEDRTKTLKKTELNNSVLAKKQAIIRDITEKAKKRIKCFESEEYFKFLLKLLQKYCLNEKGQILLSPDDVKRMPTGFSQEIKKRSLEVKGVLKSQGDGFVLVYGNIEVNCTIDELFQSKKSEICDLINGLLFN